MNEPLSASSTCPICNKTVPHYHIRNHVVDWIISQVNRFRGMLGPSFAKIQRYDVRTETDCGYSWNVMSENENGRWVSYEDYKEHLLLTIAEHPPSPAPMTYADAVHIATHGPRPTEPTYRTLTTAEEARALALKGSGAPYIVAAGDFLTTHGPELAALATRLEIVTAELADADAAFIEMEARAEAAERDAARYRWLRELDSGAVYNVIFDCDGIHPEMMDKAVAGAMAREAAAQPGTERDPPLKVSASTERVWRAIYERVCFAGESVADVMADYDIAAPVSPPAATVGEGTGTPWTVLSALDRFNATCEDDESTDLPRPILDALVAFGYLCKPKRGYWEMTPAGEAALTPQTVGEPLKWAESQKCICGALERAGITDCDDPGEAIDVLREGYEKRLTAQPAAGVKVTEAMKERACRAMSACLLPASWVRPSDQAMKAMHVALTAALGDK